MKQNYNLLTRSTASTLAWNTFIQKSTKTTSLLVVLFMLLGFSDAFGQVANYTFSESAGTYTSAAGTTVHATGWDDAVSANTIPLGFTFLFNGTSYTTCSIATNGFLTFGGTLAGAAEYTPISSGTGYLGAISALGFDLISNASTITYTTIGTAPNRTFIAQWNNARRFSGSAIAGDFNFQIRLNETTNIINIVYGACAPATNTNYNVQVGLRGASNADFNNRSFASNAVWDNSTTAGGANNATCRTRSSSYPTTGRTFTWTPPPPPPANNLCSGAIPLSIGATCTYSTYTNANATDSGVANPGCASYLGGDVWFSVVVPANGTITIDTQTGVILDSGIAIYSGTCGALTLIECDDDDSANGAMSSITRTGLTPGSTIFIRVWEFGNNNNGTFGICVTSPLPPTITSLGAASGCVGSSLVINGTNLTGATAVTIGGTTATITGNTATTVTVTVGAGTTGTVQVTNPNGTATSAATFTVNPTPAAIAGGAATVCVGGTTPAFTNAVGGGTWSITNGSGSATISIGGVVTGVTAGTATVIYSIGTCTASTPITIITIPATVVGPSPANAAINVCYAGAGAVTSVSWTASASATSYDVYFGAGSLPGTVTANVATNTYNTGALAASTTYYWRVVAWRRNYFCYLYFYNSSFIL